MQPFPYYLIDFNYLAFISNTDMNILICNLSYVLERNGYFLRVPIFQLTLYLKNLQT